MASRVHVAFSVHAGQIIKLALANMGVDEPVISLEDDLGYGPIEPPDVDLRASFERDAFVYEVPFERRASVREFWDQVSAPDVEPVLWMSRRCVRELTGCMEWLSRCDAPPLVLDIATIDFGPRAPRLSAANTVGVLDPDDLAAYRALGYVRRMSTAAFDADRSAWSVLKSQNAPLRVLEDSGLASKPITYFDSLLIACASDDWQPGARVMGDAIARLVIEDPYRQCGDHVLMGRLRKLVDDGALDGEGDFSDGLRDTRVRKPR